jgi:D-xylonolactonase
MNTRLSPAPTRPLPKASPPTWRMPDVTAPECVWQAGAALGEGAHWSVAEQALYWVDITGRRLHRWRPDGGVRDSWRFDQEISAVAERAHAPGLVVALRHGLAHWNPQTPDQRPQLFCLLEHNQPLNRCNDGRCDAQGRFWVGTMDAACRDLTGSLYAVAMHPDTGLQVRSGQPGMTVINGPAWTRDGRTLLLNDTQGGRVWAYDFDPHTGAMTNRRLWLQFAPGDGYPDGLCIDAAGRVWICHWDGACVTCHDPLDARELGRIDLPARQVTSCAFGGPDLRTLFITTAREGLDAHTRLQQPQAGGLFAVRVSEPGLPPHPFAG